MGYAVTAIVTIQCHFACIHPWHRLHFTRKELPVANLFYIFDQATDRDAAGSVPMCAAGIPAATRMGKDSILGHRTRTAAGEISALVARCMR
jgi:hypothetical protein